MLVATAFVLLMGCDTEVPLGPTPPSETYPPYQRAFVEALAPRRPDRPTIAVVALNEATETTDFLVTHAVLKLADVADVVAVAPRRGRVSLYPALEVEVTHDFAGFDKAHPNGADYVIVPAMDDRDAPVVTTWIAAQAHLGAQVIGVCAGALMVGRAGLLDGRQFTTHWYYRELVAERHPGARLAAHRRYVFDRGVATTTGITASIPAMLSLVEAIGGHDKAQRLAMSLGVRRWGPEHDSGRYGLNARRKLGIVLNKLAFWRRDRFRLDVHDGMDDVALAFVADAWSRTDNITVVPAAPGPVTLQSGLTLLARPAPDDLPRVPRSPQLSPMQQLDRTLCEIDEHFGPERRAWVMMELEYPDAGAACTH